VAREAVRPRMAEGKLLTHAESERALTTEEAMTANYNY
jgi:hypothetical protein